MWVSVLTESGLGLLKLFERLFALDISSLIRSTCLFIRGITASFSSKFDLYEDLFVQSVHILLQ